MKLLKTLALSTALALAPLAAANAAVFNFSYTFTAEGSSTPDPISITGSFTGDLEGSGATSFIDHISSLSVFMNSSLAFNGPVNAYTTDASGNVTGADAKIYFDAASNSFAFFDGSADFSTATNMFGIFGNTAQLSALVNNSNGFLAGNEAVTSSWNVAAVPEPSSYALLLAGLGLMTMVARRRSQR